MPDHLPDDDSPRDLRALWQSLPPEPAPPAPLAPLDLQPRMHRMHRRIYWRNLREYAAIAVVIAVLGAGLRHPQDLIALLASVLEIAGCLYVAVQLHRRASARPAPADLGAHSGLAFYRFELQRQRDALRAVWHWYLLPIVPGLVLGMIGALHRSASSGALPRALGFTALYTLCIALFFWIIWKLNHLAAARLQGKIDALDALQHDPQP